MKVTYIDHMGTDLTVVNAARVSFNKQSQWGWECPYCTSPDEECWTHDDVCGYMDKPIQGKKVLLEKDEKLIAFLARGMTSKDYETILKEAAESEDIRVIEECFERLKVGIHFTPFAHPHLMIHIKAPIFVARQLDKHIVGMIQTGEIDLGELTKNEVSRRYVDSEPEFYLPNILRGTPKDKKQGSTGVINSEDQPYILQFLEDTVKQTRDQYHYMLECGVCPEQARMILPLNTYTEWYWTGSLYAFTRVINLRCAPDAQQETRELCEQLIPILQDLWPVSSKYLIGEKND